MGCGCLDHCAENNFEADNTTYKEECCDQLTNSAKDMKNGVMYLCFVTIGLVKSIQA